MVHDEYKAGQHFFLKWNMSKEIHILCGQMAYGHPIRVSVVYIAWK